MNRPRTHLEDIEQEAANDVVEAKLLSLTATLEAEQDLAGKVRNSCMAHEGPWSCNRPRDHYGDVHAEIMAPQLGQPVRVRALWIGKRNR
jgi:hypothetical protein